MYQRGTVKSKIGFHKPEKQQRGQTKSDTEIDCLDNTNSVCNARTFLWVGAHPHRLVMRHIRPSDRNPTTTGEGDICRESTGKRREPSSKKKKERHVALKYEASPRVTEAAYARAQANAGSHNWYPHGKLRKPLARRPLSGNARPPTANLFSSNRRAG